MAEQGPMVKVCGLWKNRSQKTGKEYLAGNLGSVKLMIFPNKFKSKDTEPDFQAYVTARDFSNAGGDLPEGTAFPDGPGAMADANPVDTTRPEDDIPF